MSKKTATEQADRLANLITTVADQPLNDVAPRQLREELKDLYERLENMEENAKAWPLYIPGAGQP